MLSAQYYKRCRVQLLQLTGDVIAATVQHHTASSDWSATHTLPGGASARTGSCFHFYHATLAPQSAVYYGNYLYICPFIFCCTPILVDSCGDSIVNLFLLPSRSSF